MQKIRVGFFTTKNVRDRNAFSGTLYYMHKALKSSSLEVVDLTYSNLFYQSSKVIRKLQDSRLFRGDFSPPEEQHENLAQKVEKQLQKNVCDIIFAPVAAKELSFLRTDLPIIYLSDATPKLIADTYNFYSSKEELLSADQRERLAISKASQVIYSSQWAAQSAISDYGANPQKVNIVPFGANIDTVPETDQIVKKCQQEKCTLLFIGKDWKRKGGEIAFQTLVSLLDLGVHAELIILGCIPPSEFKHPNLKLIPFLNKNLPQEQQQLSQLLLESNFLIFPTRADCSPIVICEANAYGIPVITTNVGGIPSIIKNGKNGYIFPLSASGDDYANSIARNFAETDTYKKLVLDSRREYDLRLNWDQWANRISQIISDTFREESQKKENFVG